MMQKIRQREVVGIVLYNEAGEILLQLRDDDVPGLPYPGCWTTFGGAMEGDESPEQAIRRELLEELELALEPRYWMSYRCPARSIAGEVETTVHMFTARLDEGDSLPLHEGQAKRYFAQDAISDLTLAFEKGPVLARFFADFAGGEAAE